MILEEDEDTYAEFDLANPAVCIYSDVMIDMQRAERVEIHLNNGDKFCIKDRKTGTIGKIV